MYVYTTILHRVQRVKQHTSSTSVLRVRYNYITSCAKCKTADVDDVCCFTRCTRGNIVVFHT
jgi:hypothetical protein